MHYIFYITAIRPSTVKFKEKSEEISGKQERLKKNLSLSLNTGPSTDNGIVFSKLNGTQKHDCMLDTI